MKTSYIITIVLILIIIFVSWRYFRPSAIEEPKPNLTNDIPKPNVTTDVSDFVDAGCVKKDKDWNCSSIGLEDKYSCLRLKEPSEYLSGLSPKVPIILCDFIKTNQSRNEGITARGCMLPVYNKYIVLVDEKFKVINNKTEFVEFFAPVETPEEALSFAVALTTSYPLYNISIPSKYRVFVSNINTTYVEETNEGYKVHLFSYGMCGCGPHSHYEHDYLVTKTGEVKEITSQKIYENPDLDGMCID